MYIAEWSPEFSKAYYAAAIESEAIIRAIKEEHQKLKLDQKEWIRGICLLKWLGVKEIKSRIVYINAEKRPAYVSKSDLERYKEAIKKIGVIEYLRRIIRKVRPGDRLFVRFASYPKGAKAKWVVVVK